MTYSRSCGVPVASCAAETCVCVCVDPGAELGRENAAGELCPCAKCDPGQAFGPFVVPSRLNVCPICGNKRCPKGTDHDRDCTGSNEPGQSGSRYAAPDVRDQYAQTANQSREDC